MTKQNKIQLFNEHKVRTVWDSDTEEWYFSVVDVVEILTDSVNPTDYLKKMRKRDPELGTYIGTNCPQVLMTGDSGRKRKTLAATTEQLFRIIQSIPSPKAEPFKQWMAQVAATRIDQMQDPELSIEQAVEDYRRLGYSEQWINQRIRGIDIRKMLTDEWKRGGVDKKQYGYLTDIITSQWSGMKTREYKDFKGLHKESLRDNMTNIELALNMLAEASATELSKQQNPESLGHHIQVAKSGGKVAKAARNELEAKLGRSVISPAKASDYLQAPDPPKEID
ncbi:MAG: Bro-N domain-containing protein [Muribaculaceae bacterium]|nr:Bro-N domain-containing protein [Muribaculaceae bacterium]